MSGGSRGGTPSAWDPRVLPIVKAVEQDRGLTLSHPVKVNFLDAAAFQAKVGQGDALSPSDRAALNQQAAELRALGLATGPLDLASLETKADQVDTVGYYDTDTKQIYVEGNQLTPYVRVTLAHELTHVLQDQHLDLSRLDNLPDDQQPAVSALIEGDAVTVENDYEANMSAADQKTYDSESSALDTAGPAGNSGGGPSEPDFLANAASFPYDFGPPFVDALLAAGGNQRVNEAFTHPPTAEAQIVDPSQYLSGSAPVSVPAPELPSGGKQLQPPAAFGQLSLAEVLGTRLGYGAWPDVESWVGDSSLLYSLGGKTCVAIDTVLNNDAGAANLQTGAQQWAQSIPGAAVSRTGRTVEIRACDPGPSFKLPPSAQPALYDVLLARADMIDQLVTGSVPSAARAECMADGALTALSPAAAVAWDQSDAGAPSDSAVEAAENASASSCPG